AQSACYLTDYYIDLPTAELFGGSRTPRLLRQATAAGLLEPSGRGNTRRWKIMEDEDLFNIRACEDVEGERQRDRERRAGASPTPRAEARAPAPRHTPRRTCGPPRTPQHQARPARAPRPRDP